MYKGHSNKGNTNPKITRDRRMWCGAALSVAVTTGLTVALCAAVPAPKSQQAPSVHLTSVSASQSPSNALETPCRTK